MEYKITIKADTVQTHVINADTVSDALEKAKRIFVDNEVEGTPQNIHRPILQDKPKIIINPPEVKETHKHETETLIKQWKKEMPT